MYTSSIYPIKINRYQPQQKPVQDSEKDGQSNSSTKQEQQERNYNTIYRPTPGYYGNQNFAKIAKPNINQYNQANVRQQNEQTSQSQTQNAKTMTRQQFPNGEKTAIDYTQSKINISQVIKDFQNTTEAIGSPDDIKDTVNTYVSLVKKEAEKEKPNKKIIQSNLKNASQVLDEYITDTLKKPSKVVEGWIDSLFLQNVDYKYDESIINPDYQVKLPEKNNKAKSVEKVENTPQETHLEQPQNPYIATLISAKREKNPAEALNIYESVIENAKNDNDSKALSIAYFESGKLYDGFNSLDKAVENYTKAIEATDDNGLKAQAYMKIAQIQHDNSNLKEAGENYFSSIAYFGEVDNKKAQAVLMTQAGKLACEQFDKEKTQDYFYIANALADDLEDKTLIGKINQKAGDSFSYLNEPKDALGYYKTSAASYNEIENNVELAKDYQSAAQLMLDLGNPAKARKLLNKAYKASIKTENTDLIKNIQSQIEVLS